MRKLGTIRRLYGSATAQQRNSAIVRGILLPQSRPFPPLPPFSGRLPRTAKGCPQLHTLCLRFADPCREFQKPCRDLRSLARNCNPSAAKLPCLAGKLRRLAAKLPPLAAKLRRLAANCTTPAAKLPGLAANFTASAPIYKKLPTSHLQQLTQKNARNAGKSANLRLCSLRSFAAKLYPNSKLPTPNS